MLTSFCHLFQDLVDWNKAILPQVGKLRADYLSWVHSPVDRPLRLFESDFVEFFSTTPWYVVPIIWIPIILFVSFLGFHDLTTQNGIGSINPYYLDSKLKALSAFSLLFLFGIFIWSLIEYVLHRFLFHLINHVPADDPFWITIHFFLHGQHHKVCSVLSVLCMLITVTWLYLCVDNRINLGRSEKNLVRTGWAVIPLEWGCAGKPRQDLCFFST